MADSEIRSDARRLAIFNHKGGVGKTTLTMNIGAALAARGRRVLLVDTDPQCNLTSYLVASDVVDDLLDNSDGEKGQTVWSAVKPVSEALGGVLITDPIELTIENVFRIPGDIRLSEFEGDLNEFWAQSLQRKARGFRGTMAISDLVSGVARPISRLTMFSTTRGQTSARSTGRFCWTAINSVVPVACDLFSLRALKTLGRTLVDWITNWDTIAELAPSGTPLLTGRPAFLGYIAEGFRTYGGTVTQQQSYYLAQIEKEIYSQVVALLRGVDPKLVVKRRSFKLGEVKDFGALVPASQRVGSPSTMHPPAPPASEKRHTRRYRGSRGPLTLPCLGGLHSRWDGRAEDHLIQGILTTFDANRHLVEVFLDQLYTALSNSAQLTPHVHSMRGRIKDRVHLEEKLRRKIGECEEKGRDFGIDPENLLVKINDLAGVADLASIHATDTRNRSRAQRNL